MAAASEHDAEYVRRGEIHFRVGDRLHGVACNRYSKKHRLRTTDDLGLVTCSICMGVMSKRCLDLERTDA